MTRYELEQEDTGWVLRTYDDHMLICETFLDAEGALARLCELMVGLK